MANQYVFLNEKFYLVEEDANRTIGATQQEVSPEQAVPSLIADWLEGKLYSVSSLEAGTQAESTPVSDSAFAAGVIDPVFNYVMNQSIPFDERVAILRDILGTTDSVILLFRRVLRAFNGPNNLGNRIR